MLVVGSHLLRRVAHPLTHHFGGNFSGADKIRPKRMPENVESSHNTPFAFSQCLLEMVGRLITSERLLVPQPFVIETDTLMLTSRVEVQAGHCFD